MVLPFDPLDLTFHHLNYYVDLPKVSTAVAWRAYAKVRLEVTIGVHLALHHLSSNKTSDDHLSWPQSCSAHCVR